MARHTKKPGAGDAGPRELSNAGSFDRSEGNTYFANGKAPSCMVEVAGRPWEVRLLPSEDRGFLRFRLIAAGPDERPRRRGPSGRQTRQRVGRRRLSLTLHRREHRLVRCGEAAHVPAHDEPALVAAVLEAEAAASGSLDAQMERDRTWFEANPSRTFHLRSPSEAEGWDPPDAGGSCRAVLVCRLGEGARVRIPLNLPEDCPGLLDEEWVCRHLYSNLSRDLPPELGGAWEQLDLAVAEPEGRA